MVRCDRCGVYVCRRCSKLSGARLKEIRKVSDMELTVIWKCLGCWNDKVDRGISDRLKEMVEENGRLVERIREVEGKLDRAEVRITEWEGEHKEMQGRLDVEEGGKRRAWEQVYKLRERLKAEKEKGRKVRDKMEKMRGSRETGNEGGGQAGNVVEELREEIGRLVKEEAKLREEKAELGKRIGVIGRELEEAKRSNERMLHFSQKRVDRIKE